jgi:hypothetical protein
MRAVADLGAEGGAVSTEPGAHLGSAFTASHAINIFDGDARLRDFLGEIAVQLDRLQAWAIPVKAVALREDLWPTMTSVHGYPVIRLAASSPVTWGVVT